MHKLCPDFKYPCLKDDCISYISEFTYVIDNFKFMDILCKDLNFDFTTFKYPVHLIFPVEFCKKYSSYLEQSPLLTELNRIQQIIDLNLVDINCEVVYV
jgi:hypothetical protein